MKVEEILKMEDIREKEEQLIQMIFKVKPRAFSSPIYSRLLRAFADKYNPRTQSGKVQLQRHMTILREANANNKIPVFVDPATDHMMFSSILEERERQLYPTTSTTSECSVYHDYVSSIITCKYTLVVFLPIQMQFHNFQSFITYLFIK